MFKRILQSGEYIFSSSLNSEECLRRIKKYSKSYPQTVTFEGGRFYVEGRMKGNNFKTYTFNMWRQENQKCFYGEVFPGKKGCLIKGRFKLSGLALVLIFCVPVVMSLIKNFYLLSAYGFFLDYLKILLFFICLLFINFSINFNYKNNLVIFMKRILCADLMEPKGLDGSES